MVQEAQPGKQNGPASATQTVMQAEARQAMEASKPSQEDASQLKASDQEKENLRYAAFRQTSFEAAQAECLGIDRTPKNSSKDLCLGCFGAS